MKTKHSFSAKETHEIAFALATDPMVRPQNNEAVVFALRGELGSGKTTFVQGFAAGLGVQEKVLSPTFVIMKTYAAPQSKQALYHIDCYRIKGEDDLIELGWNEIVKNPQNIILVEWPERIQNILPPSRTEIMFHAVGAEKRDITISSL